MENLLYELRPFLLYALEFISGQLDHPVKWLSVAMFIIASLMITRWRYVNRGRRAY